MLLDVLNLLHNFSENLGAVLRRIPILDQANFDVKFKLVANILIVEPVCKRRFCINDFFDFPSQRAALLIYRNTVDNFVFAVFKIVLVAQRHQNIIECLLLKSETNLPEAFAVRIHFTQNA